MIHHRLLVALVIIAFALSVPVWEATPAGAQTVREVFQKVAPSVVIIRARGRDVGAGGQSRFA